MFVDASFIVSGSSDKLELEVSSDYINWNKGNFCIKLISFAVHMKVTTVQLDSGEEIFISVSENDEFDVDSIVTITCSGCSGFYKIPNESAPKILEIPLAQVRLHRLKNENVYCSLNTEWHPVKHFEGGKLKFSLKDSFYDDTPLHVPNEISLHFVLRRLRE